MKSEDTSVISTWGWVKNDEKWNQVNNVKTCQ
jgi:hypothetical protein